MYPSPRSAAALALMWLGLAATAFAAQPNASGVAPAARAHPRYAGEPSQIPANGKPIVLEVGKGTLIRLSRPASTVFVASPDIADVQIKSPELIYVSAKAPGQTVIYAVDGGDTVLLNAPVRVDFDLSELHQSLNRLVPGTDISVTQVMGWTAPTRHHRAKMRSLIHDIPSNGAVHGASYHDRFGPYEERLPASRR